jgi:hypothetical protein
MSEFVHTHGADADAAMVPFFFISGSNLTPPSLASWGFSKGRGGHGIGRKQHRQI